MGRSDDNNLPQHRTCQISMVLSESIKTQKTEGFQNAGAILRLQLNPIRAGARPGHFVPAPALIDMCGANPKKKAAKH